MKTVLTNDTTEAAKFIRRGGIVAFPTETVYGLGANVFDERAVAKIFSAKQRPADNPLIAHVADIGQISALAVEIADTARRFIDVFFPGPLTLVLKKAVAVPLIATAGLDTVGVRMPRHEIANEFLRHCGVPVVAPSANLSGRPSPTTWQAVFEDLDGRIDCILQSDATEIGLESTVVDCRFNNPTVLRSGSVSIEQLREVVSQTELFAMNGDDAPRSPGLRHRHYSPRAKVIIVENVGELQAAENAGFIGLARPVARFERQVICSNIDDYARRVFEFFRDCDRRRIDKIYCERVPTFGVGLALMDRVERAAKG